MSNKLYSQSFIMKWKILRNGQKIYISLRYHRVGRLARMPSTTARPFPERVRASSCPQSLVDDFCALDIECNSNALSESHPMRFRKTPSGGNNSVSLRRDSPGSACGVNELNSPPAKHIQASSISSVL